MWPDRGTPAAGCSRSGRFCSPSACYRVACGLGDWAIGLIVGIDLVFWGAQMIAAAQSLRPVTAP